MPVLHTDEAGMAIIKCNNSYQICLHLLLAYMLLCNSCIEVKQNHKYVHVL